MHCRAFTLFELLITLAVLAAGLSTAVLASRDFSERRLWASSANTLMRGLEFARAHALLARRTVTMCASADGERCGGRFGKHNPARQEVAAAANSKRDNNEHIILAQPALAGRLRLAGGLTRRVRFLPNGRASYAGRVVLCHKTETHRRFAAIISPGGLVRRGDKGEADACAA